MKERSLAGRQWSRRSIFPALLGAAAPVLARKGVRFAPQVARYADPSTEFLVTRLTDPSFNSILPGPHTRFVSKNGKELLFSSDRDGTLQVCHLDVDSGEMRLLTEAAALVPQSVQLLRSDHEFLYFDGPRLQRSDVRRMREETVYEIPEGWRRGRGLSSGVDGESAAFVETNGRRWRIRLVDMKSGRERVVADAREELADPQLRPAQPEILFRKGQRSLWVARIAGPERELATEPGTAGPAIWVDDGRTICYLNLPDEPGQLNALREHYPDKRQDTLIGKTTQFVDFSANRNGSVFLGASGGRATPFVILMLRTTAREFTLCEHRASDPREVKPVFSPNSRSIFFQSDRDGKNAIYSMDVRELVEATDDS